MVAPVLRTTPMKHAAKLRKQKHCIDTIAEDITPIEATRCVTSNDCLRRARTARAAMQPKANKKREATMGVRVRNSDCRFIQDGVHGTVRGPVRTGTACAALRIDTTQFESNRIEAS